MRVRPFYAHYCIILTHDVARMLHYFHSNKHQYPFVLSLAVNAVLKNIFNNFEREGCAVRSYLFFVHKNEGWASRCSPVETCMAVQCLFYNHDLSKVYAVKTYDFSPSLGLLYCNRYFIL